MLGEVLLVHPFKQATWNLLMQKKLALGNEAYWKQTQTATFPVTLGLKHTILRTRTNCSCCLWWCCFLVFSFLSLSICCPFCLDCVRFERLYSLFAQWLAWCDHSSGSWESVVTVEICGCGIGVFISFVCVWKGEEDLCSVIPDIMSSFCLSNNWLLIYQYINV